jgi:c-di-GMP-binding flagellar brake protein YcgR
MPGVARVSFNTTVRGRQGGESPSATLTIPDSVERVQERQWVRLPCTLPAVFMTESRPDDTPVDATPVKTKTGDISGNGVMVWSPESLPKGTRVRLLIELTELKHRIDCISEVMRTIRPESDSAIGGFWLGLRFDIIRESDREAVIRYIFNQQRERKKKGLLI